MVVTLIESEGPVKDYTTTTYEEMLKDMKSMSHRETRNYTVLEGKYKGFYQVSGSGRIIKANDNPDNGNGPFDDILPP